MSYDRKYMKICGLRSQRFRVRIPAGVQRKFISVSVKMKYAGKFKIAQNSAVYSRLSFNCPIISNPSVTDSQKPN